MMRSAGNIAMALMLVVLGGCARGCTSSRPPIHLNPNMDHQPKYKAQAESDFFYDGATMRVPVEGTVARGTDLDPAVTTGFDSAGNPLAFSPIETTPELLARGLERYEIFCGICHGERGDGQGMLTQVAQVSTADLLEQRIVDMPDGQIFDTITNGFGLMPGYDYPLSPRDRWAIIAQIREMQSE